MSTEYTVVAQNVMDEEEGIYHDTGKTVDTIPNDVEDGEITMVIIVHGREFHETMPAKIWEAFGIAFVDENELEKHF